MENICFGEDYNTKFDADWHVANYFSKGSFIMKEGSSLSFLHTLFSNICDQKDARLLEFGCGPCIYTILSASKVFQHITMAEYAWPNRQAIEKWVRNDKDAIDWTPVSSFVADLEQKSVSEVEIRSRKAIKEVIKCDLNEENILLEHTRQHYDFIITSLTVVSSCKSIEEYQIAVKKICSLLKPGGGLVFIEILQKVDFFPVGDYKFFALPLTMEAVTDAVEKANMEIERLESIHMDETDIHVKDRVDFDYVMMFAKKENCCGSE